MRKKELKINNKYENIDIIELENPEDIVESFINCVCEADLHGKTVAIIANKDLVLHAMNEVMEYDVFNIRRVDIEMNDIEYMISIDKDSNLVVQPVIEYQDKFFSDIDIAYISMDGDICQITIDRLVNSDKDVILFGLEDEDSCDGDCENCDCKTTEFDTDDGYHITVKADLDADEALDAIKEMETRMVHMSGMMDEIMNFKKLFKW